MSTAALEQRLPSWLTPDSGFGCAPTGHASLKRSSMPKMRIGLRSGRALMELDSCRSVVRKRAQASEARAP
jgi:hypothetical protein